MGWSALLLGLVTALVFFPVLPAIWGFLGVFAPSIPLQHPLTRIFFESWDAGGQQALSRNLLCAQVSLAVVVAICRGRQRCWNLAARKVWSGGLLFLGLGLVSSLAAGHRFQALREWELWLLLGLLVYLVADHWQARLLPYATGAVYVLSCVILLHSLWVALPSTQGRLGGILHHPNALSTLCLMLLPVLFARSGSSSNDRVLGQLLSGAMIALVLQSGSLTGLGILVVLSANISLGVRSKKGAALSLGALPILLLGNLWGGWWSLAVGPVLLLGCWLGGWIRSSSRVYLRETGLIVVAAGLVILFCSLMAPRGLSDGAADPRDSSGLARLELYRVGIEMVRDFPFLGVGPSGFGRYYPSYQHDLRYFSKYVHCLPLEVACEWGLPAFVSLLFLFGSLLAFDIGDCTLTLTEKSLRGVLWVFFAHSLTGVQSQFPYLFVLFALAWGVLQAEEVLEQEDPRHDIVDLAARFFLGGLAAFLVWFHLSQAEIDYDRELAIALSSRLSASQNQPVRDLLASAFFRDPLNSETARLWGHSCLLAQDHEAALAIARETIELDPQRGSCFLLLLLAQSPTDPQRELWVRRAQAVDPVNYPSFYRILAEIMVNRRQWDEALELLRNQNARYEDLENLGLPSFRFDDLSEQLVEYYALKALLVNREDPKDPSAESDLRKAIYYCQGDVRRVTRLAVYPSTVELLPQGVLQTIFADLTRY